MKRYHPVHLLAALTCVLTVLSLAPARAQDAPPPAPAQEQPEVLTRGPVHESFAEPVDTQMQQAGLAVNVQPPAAVAETPPAYRPVDGQSVWVPGYWAWDADRNGYIWVSGCWRIAPPQKTWVPGYWAQTPAGWQWIPGFWTASGVQELEYLPAPPALPNAGPPVAAPSADVVWVPPCWYWVSGRYVIRAGYWLTVQPNWVWVPSHYVWTPRGHVFVTGHWDFPLTHRGVLFAPVAIHERVVFSPTITLDIGSLTVNLFAYPRYHHYFFGDYYDAAYVAVGIHPWYECVQVNTWYDPIFVHERWRLVRTEPGWEARIRHDFELRRADRDLRPPHTYIAMEARMGRAPEAQRRVFEVARPIERSTVRVERVSAEVRIQVGEHAHEMDRFRDDRHHWETPAAHSDHRPDGPPRPVQPTQPERVRINLPPPSPHMPTMRRPDDDRRGPGGPGGGGGSGGRDDRGGPGGRDRDDHDDRGRDRDRH